ncbi:MAG: HisA/HisF-related TIM barrel protein [Candidatus Omnitrophica bacterium]|nr:HisA/HisF-related TIM barrel protein [Candidatus Omnitrophota bacterium]MDD5352411.1 HisA/HisF-related TIM barrel protein [Candidatus Omnitrophota bacterium]
MLSRNFSLQSVGNIDWIRECYNFDAIAFSIDELIVFNVEREKKDVKEFSRNLIELSKRCFMPIAAGGGIRSIEDAYMILDAGADKLVINTPVITNPELVISFIKTFGSQCIVASIDYKKHDRHTETFIHDGSHSTGLTVEEHVKKAERLNCGEIYLTSMDNDGTGEGLDLDIIKKISEVSMVPLIASGGIGKFNHFTDGILQGKADAVSTANLFNFIEDGLTDARSTMQKCSIDMASWDIDFFKSFK